MSDDTALTDSLKALAMGVRSAAIRELRVPGPSTTCLTGALTAAGVPCPHGAW